MLARKVVFISAHEAAEYEIFPPALLSCCQHVDNVTYDLLANSLTPKIVLLRNALHRRGNGSLTLCPFSMLPNLLSDRRHAKYADPRDKIYALLAMTNVDTARFEVDYSISLACLAEMVMTYARGLHIGWLDRFEHMLYGEDLWHKN